MAESILTRISNKLFGKRSSSAYTDFDANNVDDISYHSEILHNNAVAARAVDIVASACMNTEPLCMSGEKAIQATATKLLTKPNPTYTGDKLVYKVVEDVYIGYEAKSYIVAIGNVNVAPTELYRIDPRKVSEFKDTHGKIIRITVLNDDYQGEYVADANGRFICNDNLKEILIIQHPSERGALNSVKEELDILSMGLNRNGALIKNGGRISTLLAFKDGVSPDEITARMHSIERVIRSKGYGGMLGVSAGEHGVDVKEMGLSPRDLDFAQLQEVCRREVFFRCGVPVPLTDSDAATFNNVEAAREMLLFNTVIPLCDLIYSTIGEFIAMREKKQYTCKTNQSIIPELRTKQLKELETLKKAGVNTINEMRALSGLEPVDGGDTLLVEARLVPINALGAQ